MTIRPMTTCPKAKRRLVILVVAIAVALALGAFGWRQWQRYRHQPLTWQKVNAMISKDFPGVHQITIPQLNAWLNDPARKPPLLLDVRTKREYEVSHLHNARLADANVPVRKLMAGITHGQPIVTYCSVSYRSSAFAQRLMSDGYAKVYDLKGSIFAWANAGLPVYRHGRVVHHVDPYNAYWGQLLKRSLWAQN